MDILSTLSMHCYMIECDTYKANVRLKEFGPQRSRRGPQNNITQKTASISPNDDQAVLVR